MPSMKMSRRRNPLSETLFLAEVAADMTDEEVCAAFKKEFGRPISIEAIRKRRQRLGLAKRGWDGKFEMVPKDKGEENG